MARVSGGDLHEVFRFLGSAVAGTREDPLPVATLTALRELIPADQAAYFERRRVDGDVLRSAFSDTEDPPSCDQASPVLQENPLGWRRWRPADGALRLSTVIRRRELEKLEFYRSFMVPRRIHDTLKVWLSSTPESASCVTLDRPDGEFTSRDQDVLGILQHHLVRFREQALRGRLPATADGVGLTVREAEVLTWAARGMTNVDVANVLGTSPATVGKHLEHAYEKLGVHSRAEALELLTHFAASAPGRNT